MRERERAESKKARETSFKEVRELDRLIDCCWNKSAVEMAVAVCEHADYE